ncbi:MAG: ABC transporter ATP-binding protein [Gammaproteobacteria bacterium]|nr:MAG: ABC transporter ATP-binding protein [Gammaproteobacteria bacterium]
MIDLKQLLFSYGQGDFRLDIPALNVTEGEKLAVIGPSGSGKTTLLNLIAGIFKPVQGSVHVNDIEVSQLSDAARRDFRINNIGFVFQDFELLEYLNVMDNILHPYRITSALKLTPDVRDRARTLARQMGIDDKLGRSARDLSQGEKQRAAICRALLPGPSLILADEATGNLDPRNKDHILDLLFESVESHGATLLAVTHDHELLPRFDRVMDFAEFRNEATA